LPQGSTSNIDQLLQLLPNVDVNALEIRIKQTLQQHPVILGWEGSSTKLAIYTGEDKLPDTYAERFLKYADKDQTTKNCVSVGLIFRTYTIRHDPKRSATRIVIEDISKDYKGKEIPEFVIVAGLSTDHVVIMPKGNIQAGTWAFKLTPDEYRLSGGAIPSLFPQFNVAISNLGEAVENIRKSAITGTQFVNPHIGVKFFGVPALSTPACLLPDEPHVAEATKNVLQSMTDAHNAGKFPFKPSLSLSMPRLGNIGLLDERTNQMTKIALKVNCMEISADGSEIRHKTRNSRPDSWFFSNKREWDFFMTVTWGRDENIGYMIPEREIPDAWYTATEGYVTIKVKDVEKFRSSLGRDGSGLVVGFFG
jgi:hypothetical protein